MDEERLNGNHEFYGNEALTFCYKEVMKHQQPQAQQTFSPMRQEQVMGEFPESEDKEDPPTPIMYYHKKRTPGTGKSTAISGKKNSVSKIKKVAPGKSNKISAANVQSI